MLVDFSKENLVTMDQENESDRKHRLKTDGLGNKDEEVFATHTSLGGGFIDDKKVETSARALAYGQMRCWSRDHGCSNLHSRPSVRCVFMQTKIPLAFVNAELRRKNNRNIIPTNDIRRGS